MARRARLRGRLRHVARSHRRRDACGGRVRRRRAPSRLPRGRRRRTCDDQCASGRVGAPDRELVALVGASRERSGIAPVRQRVSMSSLLSRLAACYTRRAAMGAPGTDRVHVRNTEPRDFAQISELCRRVYPNERPWTPEQLASHLRVFPEGQLVALDRELDRVVGMSASLIVRWERYDEFDSWEDFTADGMFTNHDP